jgi:glycosyltransferase involved in cell wall biosynthesis
VKASIVIPAFNAGRYLASTIESVLAQTMRAWELIVVDDGSSDETASIAQRYAAQDPRIRVVRQENAGVARARNAGYSASRRATPYVAFLDADDQLREHALAALMSALDARPEAVAAHGRAASIDDQGGPRTLTGRERLGRRAWVDGRVIVAPDSEPTTLATLSFACHITTPGQVLIRRDRLGAADPFDPDAVPAEDWDLWLRLAQQGPIEFVPDVLIDYRQHASNASSQLGRMRRAELYVRHKLIAATAAEPAGQRLARDGLRHFEMRRCSERLTVARHELVRLRWRKAAMEVARASHSLVECGRSFIG